MIPLKFYKADASTFVVKSRAGKTVTSGKGLSFFYNPATTSIAAIPTNAQEAPFIFNLQSNDFQEIRIQGQITFRVTDALKTTNALNFTLNGSAQGYVSEDPLKLNDRVIRVAQGIIQATVQQLPLRNVLASSAMLLKQLQDVLPEHPSVASMGLEVQEVSINAIKPNAETARALEAEAREAILKEADDAIYQRRISAVEQERSIREAELQTDLSMQQKEQQIEQQKRENKRSLMREELATDQERTQKQNEVNMERIKGQLSEAEQTVALVDFQVAGKAKVDNQQMETLRKRTQALAAMPVDALEALALSDMDADKLLACGMRTMAKNADKIDTLNLSPDVFGQLIDRQISRGMNDE